jgi:hypothetical protein
MRHTERFAFLILTLFSWGHVAGSSLSEGFAEEQLRDESDQVCVTLEKHGSVCEGHVQSTNTFTALTKPGSHCKHTVNMKDNSAKDQYCDVHGVFHQTVFVHDKHCKVHWEQKAYSPMKLSYTQDKCTYGYKLKSCVPGPCEDSPDSNELTDGAAAEVIESVGRQLRRNFDSVD